MDEKMLKKLRRAILRESRLIYHKPTEKFLRRIDCSTLIRIVEEHTGETDKRLVEYINKFCSSGHSGAYLYFLKKCLSDMIEDNLARWKENEE